MTFLSDARKSLKYLFLDIWTELLSRITKQMEEWVIYNKRNTVNRGHVVDHDHKKTLRMSIRYYGP